MSIGIITTTESGVDVVFEWKIENYFNLPEMDNAWYTSPDFSFEGETWCLWIFPKVPSRNDSSGHVDLSLWKYSFGFSKQAFSLSLKTVKGEKYNEQHFTKDFDSFISVHKFNRFMPRSELIRRRTELMPDGTLTVICTLKNSTSAGSASNTGSAEYCTYDSDSAERSSVSDSGERCHKCSNYLDIIKKQKKLLEELESQKERSEEKVYAVLGLFECRCTAEVVGQTWLPAGNTEGAGSLCEDYKKVLLDGRHHDLILKVGDKELRAHRDILRARSRVFKSMLDHDMKEKNTGIINVPDCDPNAMELFLSYVYCGKIEAMDHNNMLGLYYVADKYEMMELKSECCNFIKKSLSLTNICNVIQLALKHSDSDLLAYATKYFSDNMLDIMQTVEWQSFLKDNSTIGNELLMKSIKKLKNAQT